MVAGGGVKNEGSLLPAALQFQDWLSPSLDVKWLL